jgi:hypothetical protein
MTQTETTPTHSTGRHEYAVHRISGGDADFYDAEGKPHCVTDVRSQSCPNPRAVRCYVRGNNRAEALAAARLATAKPLRRGLCGT